MRPAMTSMSTVEDNEVASAADDTGTAARRGGVTIRFEPKRVAVVVVAVVMLAVVCFGGWKFYETNEELDALRVDSTARAQAEQIALDYATGAAVMDFHDLDTWKQRLTAGTTPELAQRLTQAAMSMEQVVVPLQWTSTAEPITAKATSSPDGMYVVDCFVSVFTSNAQAPEGIQSTASYKLTIDGGNDWKITEITGIGPATAKATATPPR